MGMTASADGGRTSVRLDWWIVQGRARFHREWLADAIRRGQDVEDAGLGTLIVNLDGSWSRWQVRRIEGDYVHADRVPWGY